MNGIQAPWPAPTASAGHPPGLPPPGLSAPGLNTFYESQQPLPPPPGLQQPAIHLPYPPGFVPPLLVQPNGSARQAYTSSGNASASAPLSRTTSATTPPGLVAPYDSAPVPLDRFAPVYVPAWLLAVNMSQPPQTIVPETSRQQNVFKYAEQIYPKALVDEDDVQENLATKRCFHPGSPQKLCSGSEIDTAYAGKLTRLQVLEHKQRKEDLAMAALYAVPLSVYKLEGENQASAVSKLKPGSKQPGLYQITVPALREGWPNLDINDTVLLRQLYPETQSWQGIEFIASVWAVKRAQATIILRCDALNAHKSTMVFNVQFRPQDRPFYAAHKGLATLGSQLPKQSLLKKRDGELIGAGIDERSLAQSWLFPIESDYTSKLPQGKKAADMPKTMQWVDSNLNDEQKLAVQSICFQRRRVPFLVNGPPGTGKTKTLVEAVLQIVKAYPDAHVLVCGASNPSSDTLAARLAPHLKPSQMLRFNDESRPMDEVRPSLLPWCHVREDRFGLPDFGDLLKYRVVVTSVLDTSVLFAAKITNTHLARLQNRIYSTLHPELDIATSYHFDYLLVDEAAQASEAEITPALSVVCPDVHVVLHKPEFSRRRWPQLVLCGDHQQLGPHITSDEARAYELDLSLLQRLFERPVYAEHPKARKNLPAAKGGKLLNGPTIQDVKDVDLDAFSEAYSDSGTSQQLEASPDPSDPKIDLSTPFANLINNYRSHPGLLMVPSSLFYFDTLEPMASQDIQNTKLCRWPFLLNAEIPFLVWNVEDGQEELFEETSWFNLQEVEIVVDLVKSLIQDGRQKSFGAVQPGEISIISPMREQVWRIRLALRQLGYGDVNVGRESDLQGAENRVIIVSTVRTSHRFVADDLRKNRGLISQPKRFNVATTRAKELMVIVGHTNTLYEDPYWKAMLNFAVRRGCFKGNKPTQAGVSGPDGISRLEELYLFRRSKGGNQDVLASSMARMAMEGS